MAESSVGVLQILDGKYQKDIPLPASALRQGYVLYKAQTDFVDCRLSLDSGINESVLVVGFANPPGEGVADRSVPAQPQE